MKGISHTPGPYRIVLHAGTDGVSVEAGKGKMIANFAGAGSTESNLSNAQLFIAAPELLAAARSARLAFVAHDHSAEYPWHDHQIKQLEAAIAKAEARQ